MAKLDYEKEYQKLTEKLLNCIDDFIEYVHFVKGDHDGVVSKHDAEMMTYTVEMAMTSFIVNYYAKLYRSLGHIKEFREGRDDILFQAVTANQEIVLELLESTFREIDVDKMDGFIAINFGDLKP